METLWTETDGMLKYLITGKSNLNKLIMSLIIVNGNNIDLLKKYPDNYFDSVVTDPPYGLGKEPNASELMKDWIEHGYHEIQGKGFMGKEWDAFVPQPLFWKEVFRVLKHGGHVVAFYGTRTYDWGVMAMRFAGFEVRDCIQWIYGSGFPKSHNISKAIDKLNGAESIKGDLKFKGGTQLGVINDDNWKPKDVYEEFANTEEAKQWEGWGSALKPANEPIVLARKPLEKGLSIAENTLKWGVGGINIDATRVVTNDNLGSNGTTKKFVGSNNNRDYDGERISYEQNNLGRFPANVILSHHPECECNGLKKIKAIKGGSGVATMKSGMGKNGIYGKYSHDKIGDNAGGLGDADGNETIEDWNCHEDCPIRIMDEQSGILKSGAMDSLTKGGQFNVYGKMTERRVVNPPSEGGASRFFYCAKASKSERNRGLEGFEDKQTIGGGGGIGDYLEDVNSASGKYGSEKAPNKNFHPTVKPIKLMQYLIRMVTPTNGIVLDPFCGSGTTGIACKIEGFQFVGMEQDPEYAKIAEARINNWAGENEKVKEVPKSEENKKFSQTTLF